MRGRPRRRNASEGPRRFTPHTAPRGRPALGKRAGIEPGDRVAVLAPNVPVALAAEEIAYILDHSGAKIVLVDPEFAPRILEAEGMRTANPRFVNVEDPVVGIDGTPLPGPCFAEFLDGAPVLSAGAAIDDEQRVLSINYTSGTTGRPKGVMYTHRGALLNALGEIFVHRLERGSTFLWTLPLFHCNGWCFPWAVTGAGGVHVMLRALEPARILELLVRERVSHFNGAPTVLLMLAVTHLYGLTETYGPHVYCEMQPGWERLDVAGRAAVMARQGVPYHVATHLRVVDVEMRDVPADGETMGEVVMRGNSVMQGYYRDPEATEQAFAGGWFHSGDLGVTHPDGYIELLVEHPAVLECAVVAIPHEKWGEVPKAFIARRPGTQASERELVDFCRERLAHFKCPKAIEFCELPKTSTGKIRKFRLREKEWAGRGKRIQ